MAGHSKWANIKHRKAATDAKKGAMYAKMAREIIVAAKQGGGDPAANFRLRQAIDRAKSEGLPNENIQRAIDKGTGAGGADDLEELTYEGYGPAGVAILVKCATDNRNRTAGDIRSYFTKNGGNLGETGCVNWMFTERGEVIIERTPDLKLEGLLEASLDGGADDLDTSEEEVVTVVCSPPNLETVKTSIEKAGYQVSSAETVMSPMSTVEITDESTAKQVLKLMDTLENHDDVQHVYANFDMDAQLLESCMN